MIRHMPYHIYDIYAGLKHRESNLSHNITSRLKSVISFDINLGEYTC